MSNQTIIALQNTVAKKQPVDSTTLDDNQKRDFKAGWECPILKFENAPNNHVKVMLGHGAGEFYFFRPHVQISSQDSAPAAQFSAKDLDTMARTFFGEARGESDKGMIAVAWVIRNRAARSPAYNWPNTVAGVCLQDWQFSCWNKNDPNRPKLLALTKSNVQFRRCLKIADQVLRGEVSDPTNGADHYFANYIPTPNWARGQRMIAKHGVHQFYRLIG